MDPHSRPSFTTVILFYALICVFLGMALMGLVWRAFG